MKLCGYLKTPEFDQGNAKNSSALVLQSINDVFFTNKDAIIFFYIHSHMSNYVFYLKACDDIERGVYIIVIL
jgi:hypothetical protein